MKILPLGLKQGPTQDLYITGHNSFQTLKRETESPFIANIQGVKGQV